MEDRDEHAAGPRRGPVVLSNVLSLDGNPYLDLWNEAVRRSGATQQPLTLGSALARPAPEWVHLQWPERALRPGGRRRALQQLTGLLAVVAVSRARGARVLLTAHNVDSHDPRHPHLDRMLWRLLPPLVTDVHHMTSAGATTFLDRHTALRRATHHVIPHGSYDPVATASPRDASRSGTDLATDRPALITFGSLRGYKGVTALLSAFSGLAPGAAVLVVAGRLRDAVLRAQRDAAPAGVRFEDTFLSQDDLNRRISAADGVVLPYRAVLNSGSLMLALTLGRPVLVPDTPTFREIGDRVGQGWVHTFAGALTTDDLDRFLRSVADPPRIAPDLSWCSWERVASLLDDLWSAPSPR